MRRSAFSRDVQSAFSRDVHSLLVDLLSPAAVQKRENESEINNAHEAEGRIGESRIARGVEDSPRLSILL